MTGLLVLGAGYLGAVTAQLALLAGEVVTVADDWSVTHRWQVDRLQALGALVRTVDIRDRRGVVSLLTETQPDRVLLLAGQASRPIADLEPDRTEDINILGVRRVAEAVAATGSPPVVFGSSLMVYGPGLTGEITPDQPYGPQSDLAHLSKIYGELSLRLHAERHGFDLTVLRLGILYGPSPVEHADPRSQTVVDKFRRMAARGEQLTLDDGGHTTIGVAHVDDAAHILLATRPQGVRAEHVVAEAITVADVAALAQGTQPDGRPAWTYSTPHTYRHRIEDYLAGCRQAIEPQSR